MEFLDTEKELEDIKNELISRQNYIHIHLIKIQIIWMYLYLKFQI